MLNTSSSWNVGRAAGRCAACGKEIPPNTVCWAALCDGWPVKRAEPVAGAKAEKANGNEPPPSPFVRVDFCEECWAQGQRPENLDPAALGLDPPPGPEGKPARLAMFSFWKTTVPLPQQKKKLFVDDAVLMDVFQRLEEKTDPQEVRFRFVLALILMRKRLLKYEGTEEAPPQTDPSAPPPPAPPETWRMLPKATEGWSPAVRVINPHLTAEQITEVSKQLSAILAEEV